MIPTRRRTTLALLAFLLTTQRKDGGNFRLGIKPLYLARRQRTVLFASEVRGLVASGLIDAQIDRRGLAGFLAYGACQEPFTVFQGVESLPAGTWLELPLGGREDLVAPEPSRYWSFPPVRTEMGPSEATEAVREALSASVKSHLVSDVPLGFFLSSGVDSTLVTALAARSGANVHAYTVRLAEDPNLDEAAHAEVAAHVLGVIHTSIPLRDDEALAATHDWLGSLDLPSMDGFNVFTISRAVRQQGITVALSGQGGDELFGGYPSFFDVPRARRMFDIAQYLPLKGRGALARLFGPRASLAAREKLIDLAESDGNLLSLCLLRRRTLSNSQMRALGIDANDLGLSDTFVPIISRGELRLDDDDPIAAVSRVEARYYLRNMLLRDSDANGMAHALEIRVPFLATSVANLAFSLPGGVRLPNVSADKALLRQAFPDILEPTRVGTAKKGFMLPIGRWMVESLRELSEASIAKLCASGVVDPAGVRAIWAAFLRQPGTQNWSRAWELVVLGDYLGRLRARFPSFK